MRLNYDCLLLVMRHVAQESHRWPPPDLLAFMRTCSYLYHHGMPLLIGAPYIFAVLGDTLASFADFLLDHPERCSHLRSLHLAPTFILNTNQSAAMRALDKLIVVLTHARDSLRVLVLPDVEFLLGENPRFSTALSSLTAVKCIRIDMFVWGTLTVRMLESLKSPVSRVSLDFGRPTSSQEISLTTSLARFTNTLLDLRVLKPAPIFATHQYHAVRTLHLTRTYDLNISTLHYCFPNVAVLNLQPELPLLTLPDDVEESHRNNQSVAASSSYWSSLDVLTCQISHVYAWALPCKVRLWHIPFTPTPVSSSDRQRTSWFHSVLSSLCPSHLIIFLTHGEDDDISNVSDLFPHGCSVTHLDLTVDLYRFSNKPERTHGFMYILEAALVASVSKLDLQHFNLRILCFIARRPVIGYLQDFISSSPEEGNADYLKSANLYARGMTDTLPHTEAADGAPRFAVTRELYKMDMEVYAHSLASRCPNLQDILVHWHHNAIKLHDGHYWRVVRDGTRANATTGDGGSASFNSHRLAPLLLDSTWKWVEPYYSLFGPWNSADIGFQKRE
ncbi:hypothetical protein EIP91_010409 [Steccherinum ochraceum]|uniref:F-box domain-containing protein n=1 Tax=Steccherinum ochraceum TaxID=92696 RepID=A0A4R0R0P0_9APHY|nr:hypothetical protein EIP91_010409 [Steccherinum ochraceum]